ncbi:MAG: Holliday junction resolvase RuvX [Flavobacteriaceae bacterium]|nr:Holliday junction resolvase RuvX [Flavobacteriaceae bacterium]RCL67175.1 MAG: Holliday junction resolvase RuvX [Cryomorphaceae bacterium]|tara:strand:- start:877 stop:1287 length:411 start_codon:yes stop_codon:yes gene_type:complete
MSKIIAIDYGLKRIGVAISDESRVLAFGLDTVSVSDIIPFLTQIVNKEHIDVFVIGKPLQKDNTQSEIENEILRFIKKLKLIFPQIVIERYDERFTSLIAKKTIIESGINKKKRADKKLVDKISATLILQSFLEKK